MKAGLTEHYDSIYSEQGFAFGEEPLPLVVEALEYWHGGRVLDIGAGDGRNALFLAQKGFSVDAFDLSEVGTAKLLNRAQERGVSVNAHVRNVVVEGITEMYDVVLASFILHHLSNAEAPSLIEQMQKHTFSGGLNIITTFTKNGHFFEQNPATENFYTTFGDLKKFYADWEVLVHRAHEGRARATHPDGTPMRNISEQLIARKR